MNILILNRRDIANPAGGGAEVYTHEIAKGMVERGAQVTVFSSSFSGAADGEDIDSVRHIRRGNELTVHFRGFWYAFRHRREFDLIIDQFNGLGFFTFLIPGVRRMMLIHQLYREFWFRELGFMGALPYAVEPVLLRRYRKLPAVTVSESTKSDLKALGFQDISIVMNALGIDPLPELPQKEARPTLIFLGRLRSTKRPEDALKIYREIRLAEVDAQLWFVGRGPDEERLRREVDELEGVVFHGYVDEQTKLNLLRRAHLMLVPGVREGFGINVLEGAAMGTPAVGYDVHGLRDSIQDGRTGVLVKGPREAASRVLELLKDPERYQAMVRACLEYTRQFSWPQRAEEFWNTVQRIMEHRRS